MSEDTVFENDFDASEEAAAAATAEEIHPAIIEGELVEPEAPAEPAVPAEDDFFAENAAEEVPAVDPNKVITLVPSSADNKYVEVDGPTSMSELIARSRLQFEGDFTCFLGQTELKLTDLVPAGSTVLIAGKVKGG